MKKINMFGLRYVRIYLKGNLLKFVSDIMVMKIF